MSAYLEALLSGYGGDTDYMARDPFMQAGRSAGSWQMQPQTSSEAVWMPALQGLLSGVLTGYGQKSAKETAFDEMKRSPLLQALVGQRPASADFGPLTKGDFDESMIYGQEDAPEGWTPKMGQQDMLLQALQAEQVREEKAKATERRLDLEKLLAPKGLALDAIGGIQPLSGFADAQADILAKEAGAKKRADLQAEADILGYNPKKEEEVEKLRKEFSALPEVKAFSLVARSADAMAGALKDDSAVSDLELTRYSILLIEPGMAVREGEQAAVVGSSSIPEKWKANLGKALAGKSALTPEIRNGLRNLALRAYTAQKTDYDKAKNHFSSEAKRKGIDPERLFYLGDSKEPDVLMPPLKSEAPKPNTFASQAEYLAAYRAWEAQ